MRYVASACLACAFAGGGSASAKTIEGVYLPDLLQVPSHVLELAVCGVRDTLWIEHYVTGVYVPRGESVQLLRDAAHPKAVALHVIEHRYLPDEIPRKWRTALKSTLDRASMARLDQAYGRLREGDTLMIVYTPARGVVLSLDGEVLVRARGHGVIDAILEAWAEGESLSVKLERLERRHRCRTTAPGVSG